jgi:hypothetical protein
MLTVIQSEIPEEIIQHIIINRHKLTADVSNYAKGRLRAWIGLEAPLTDKQKFKVAPFGFKDKLWIWLNDFCKNKLNFSPEIGLLHVGGADCSDPEDEPLDGNGGECGIKRHRDAGYADFRAVGINLIGEATFGYQSFYPNQDRWSKEQNANAKLEIVKMSRGTCVVFNCKNPHFAQVGPNRWCINAWRIREGYREQYEDCKANTK